MGFPVQYLAIVIALVVPLLSFAASWGAMKVVTRQFKTSIQDLHLELSSLKDVDICKIKEKVSEMDLDQTKSMRNYVMVDDCVKIRQECSRLHISETKTLCVKIDGLSEKVSKLSENVNRIDEKRQISSDKFNDIAHKLDLSINELQVTLNGIKNKDKNDELHI